LDSPLPFKPSELIAGAYLLGPPLGRGATAVVHEATDVHTGTPVAIKRFRPDLEGDARVVRRFLREVRNTAALQHPNVVEVIRSGIDDAGVPYLVMELIRGRTLSRLLREEAPFGLDRIVAITSQILQALQAAHALSILHRDIKPSNVMIALGPPEVVKVCDFGIAKALGAAEDAARIEGETTSLTAPGELCGTPEYMSPEQARGDPLDARSDLYSVAVILYQMTTGRLPFQADSTLGTVSRLLVDLPEPPSRHRPDTSPPLETLILSALAKRREERPASAEMFLRDLLAATAASGQRPPERDPLEAPDRDGDTLVRRPAPARSRRWRLAALAALVLGALVTFRATRTPAPPQPLLSAPAPAERREEAPPRAAVAPAAQQPAGPPATAPPARHPRPSPRAVRVELPPSRLPAAEALLARRDAGGACALAEELGRDEPNNPDVHRFLGKCYMRLGRIAQAREAYQRYLELAPDRSDAPFVRAILAR
jgi:eukaryotic-like serine/threonine-protein kinase